MQVTVKPEAINERLLKTNKNLGWLAKEVGVTAGYLSEVMSTNRSPSAKLRDNMMKALNVKDWDDIFEIKQDDLDEESPLMAP